MTLGTARAILSTTWMVLALPLIVIVFLQTINDKYERWDTGFGWMIPLVFPILSLMIATWTVAETDRDKIRLKNKHVFYLSLAASVLYLALLYVVVGSMPRKATAFDVKAFDHYVQHVMLPSSWYLGTFQALIIGLVGKFFLEHIPDGDERAQGSSAGRPKSSVDSMES